MGFRFRKSLNLIPGIKINLSKSGPSFSVGGPGMTYNIGPKGNRATVGLPGSGMSYSTYSSDSPQRIRSSTTGKRLMLWLVLILALVLAVHRNWAAIEGFWLERF